MNKKLLFILLVTLVVLAPITAYAVPFHYGAHRYSSGNDTVVVNDHHRYAGHNFKNPYYHNLNRLNAYNAYRGTVKVYTLNGYTFTRYSDYLRYYNYLYTHPELYDCETCPECPGCQEVVAEAGVPFGAVPVGASKIVYVVR